MDEYRRILFGAKAVEGSLPAVVSVRFQDKGNHFPRLGLRLGNWRLRQSGVLRREGENMEDGLYIAGIQKHDRLYEEAV
ncbi:hypothetical protein D3C79_1072530 [compost metagenome]